MRRFIRMKNRMYLIFILFLVCSSVLLILSSNPKTHTEVVKSIVVETQNGIINLKNHLKDNLQNQQPLLNVDNKYLKELDLIYDEDDDDTTDDDIKNNSRAKKKKAGEDILYWPSARWKQNASEPVVVSAVLNGQSGDAVQFLRNTKLFLSSHTIILYDLGMSRHEFDHVLAYCNSTKCLIRSFPFHLFPSHVKNVKTNAFRSIVIQLVLKDAGSVLWLDIRQRLTAGGRLNGYLNVVSNSSGVLAWTMEQTIPTSALTHPKMFKYLDTVQEDYNFQHMVDLTCLLIYQTRAVREQLMDPWVKCALLEDCIEPIGAQSTGCRFDKKPGFRYSGCHGYDVSAFNIVIGEMFQFDESKYVGNDLKRFFVKMSDDFSISESLNLTNYSTIQSFTETVTKRMNIRNLLSYN